MAKVLIDLKALMAESLLLRSMPEEARKKITDRILALPPEKKKKAVLIFLKEKKQLQVVERKERKTVLDAFSKALVDTKQSFLTMIKKRRAAAEKAEKTKSTKRSLSKLKNA